MQEKLEKDEVTLLDMIWFREISLLQKWGNLERHMIQSFSNFSCMFLIPIIFSHLNHNCSNLLDMRNLQEQVKKHSEYQALF